MIGGRLKWRSNTRTFQGLTAWFYVTVSTLRLMREIQAKRESRASTTMGDEQSDADLLRGDSSWKAFRGYLRVAFRGSRAGDDRILSAKFTRTPVFWLLWILGVSAPYILVYIIRLGINPQWLYCAGCEIEPFDAWTMMIITIIGNLTGDLSNSFRVRKRDSLRIVRESILSW